METPAAKELISAYEAQKLLGLTVPVDNTSLPPARKADKSRNPHPIFRIGSKGPAPAAGDDFSLCNLILDFDLIPYSLDAGREKYEIAHDVYDNPDDALFVIGSLAFKRADVELFAIERRAYLTLLKRQLSNVVRLQKDRKYRAMPRLPRLDSVLEDIEKRIERTKSVQPEPDIEERELIRLANLEVEKIYSGIRKVGFDSYDPNAPVEWKSAALQTFRENANEFSLIQEKHLMKDSLYVFSGGQERRDFFKKLISAVMEDHGYPISEQQAQEKLRAINKENLNL